MDLGSQAGRALQRDGRKFAVERQLEHTITMLQLAVSFYSGSDTIMLEDFPSETLSDRLRKRIEAHELERDVYRSRVAYALLLDLLRENGPEGLSHREIFVDIDPAGKPFLPSANDMHVSISHGPDLAAAAISNDPVGIDIESFPTGSSLHALMASIPESFHPQERNWLMAHTDELRLGALCLIWTRKEAYLKALGIGLTRELADFSVLPNSLEIFEEVEDPSRGKSRAWLWSSSIDAAPAALSVCVLSEDKPSAPELKTMRNG